MGTELEQTGTDQLRPERRTDCEGHTARLTPARELPGFRAIQAERAELAERNRQRREAQRQRWTTHRSY